MAYATGYGPRIQKEDVLRLHLRVPREIVDAIDNFGIPKGFRSRNAAIIYLLERGLTETKKAPGSVAKQSPDASVE